MFSLPFFNLYCWVWSPIQHVAQIAQWEDEQIEYIKEKMTEEGRQEDLNKGKEPSQVSFCFIMYLYMLDFTMKQIHSECVCWYPCLSNLQIALDEAAFLLDLASVEGTWDEAAEQIAECYKQAGLHDVARFIQYRDWVSRLVDIINPTCLCWVNLDFEIPFSVLNTQQTKFWNNLKLHIYCLLYWWIICGDSFKLEHTNDPQIQACIRI